MPWTRKQVRYLESSVSPLTQAQKDKMNAELHADPSLGHKQKGSSAMKKDGKAPFHHTMITHHHDGSHTVEHHPHPKMASKSGAFMEHGEPKSYSVGDGQALMGKLSQHLGLSSQGMEDEEGDAEEQEEEKVAPGIHRKVARRMSEKEDA